MKKTLLVIATLSAICFGCTKSKNNSVTPVTPVTTNTTVYPTTIIIDTSVYITGDGYGNLTPTNFECDTMIDTHQDYTQMPLHWLYIGSNKYRVDLPYSYVHYLIGVRMAQPLVTGKYLYDIPEGQGQLMLIQSGDTTMKF